MGWKCDTRPNAVLRPFDYAFAWRSMVRWQKTNALNLMLDPSNHTRWETQMKVAQSGLRVGSVGFGMGWGERVEWQRKGCQNAVHKRDFVTIAMMSVKHSRSHRPQTGKIIKPNKERKRPMKLGPPDLSNNYVVTVMCSKNGSMCTKYEINIGQIQKTLHSLTHIFREHNQEADRLANLVSEGRRKVTSEGVKCGVMVSSTRPLGWWQKRRWQQLLWSDESRRQKNRITIRIIAVPLKVCTAMAAEIEGARNEVACVFPSLCFQI